MNSKIKEKNIVSGEVIKFVEFGDERGSLIALEALNNIPFKFKRMFYIYNTKPNVPRGFHAMKDSEQVVICLNGSVDVILDDGRQKQNYHLNNRQEGLFVEKMIWHEMHNFTEDCLLIVLTNDHYDETDNLVDYQIFLKIRQKLNENKKKKANHNVDELKDAATWKIDGGCISTEKMWFFQK